MLLSMVESVWLFTSMMFNERFLTVEVIQHWQSWKQSHLQALVRLALHFTQLARAILTTQNW